MVSEEEKNLEKTHPQASEQEKRSDRNIAHLMQELKETRIGARKGWRIDSTARCPREKHRTM